LRQLDAGKKSFLRRCFAEANARFAPLRVLFVFFSNPCVHVLCRFSTSVAGARGNDQDGNAGNSRGTVRALIGEVQREAVKVRVDIPALVQAMTLC